MGFAALLACTGLLTGLAGCKGSDIGMSSKPRSPAEVIQVTPEDGAKDVEIGDLIEVRVPSGRLERVTMRRVEDAQPVEVPGHLSEDGTSWRPDAGKVQLAAKYTVDVVALDGHGNRQARHTRFTTHVPAERFIGYFRPENRSVVGTGMIVTFQFSRPITNRAAVERGITVTSKPPVEVVGHWFGKDRLDFRPREYWRPGTEVTVAMRLRDVQAGPEMYGIQRKTVTFTIGRSQTSLVDAAAHSMVVRRDGKVLATLPVTAGSEHTATYNGKMVISEMLEVTRMNGATVGFTDADGKGEYDIKDVPHAIRLTDSGTFMHGNYWATPDTFGSRNVSHGCVGLRDVKGGSDRTPAGWFFDRALIGDVVEVVNSKDKTVAPHNGLSGWNLAWPAWKAGSALA
ncbi:Ig-like domain-containing protein [Streptomyces sannanensis]|uniref:Ig-like domain-containing protein n=1 Tax=Streptomyces sannanensis TaxID=285536 RepID=A0ABP6SFX2_9ACTN